MLKQRIITAIVLLVGLLAALFYLPSLYWAGLMALVSAVAAWEWGGLAGLKQRGRLVFGGVVLLVCLTLTVHFFPKELYELIGSPQYFSIFVWLVEPSIYHLSITWWLSCLSAVFWCLIVPFWLWQRWRLDLATWQGKGILLVLGGCLILATWDAFVVLRHWGVVFLLSVLGIAWVSDISAYFAGRKFGGKKLAPEISPGKTWAGVWGALVGIVVYVIVLVLVVIPMLPLPQELEFERPSIVDVLVTALMFVFLAILGIMGDLFESLLKRQAGIKDSSNILPGHGGVLDRIDSLIAILPCYLFTYYMMLMVAAYFR